MSVTPPDVFMIPPALVERHLALFPPAAWVNGTVEQGKQGLSGPPVWHENWWDWSKTAQSLMEAL